MEAKDTVLNEYQRQLSLGRAYINKGITEDMWLSWTEGKRNNFELDVLLEAQAEATFKEMSECVS